jgi:DNA replication factor GINS
MNLDELQSVQSRERQASSLQHLRASFYEDVGEFIGELRETRDTRAAESDNPFDDPEIEQINDQIKTAERTVESIYERRVGKVVKLASIAAADMPHDDDGLTTEEEHLFGTLVDAIEENRETVLSVLDGGSTALDCTPATDEGEATTDTTGTTGAQPTGAQTGSDGPSGHRDATPGQGGPEPADPVDERGTREGGTPGSREPTGPAEAAEASSTPDAGNPAEPDSDSGHTPGTEGDPSTDRPTPPDRPTGESPSTASGDGPDGTAGRVGEDSLDIAGAMGGSSGGPETREEPAAASGTEADVGPGTGVDGERPTTADRGGRDDRALAGAPDAPDATGEADLDDPVEEEPIDRTTVRVTVDVGDIYGVDGRSYDLSAEDVVTLPTQNAEGLVSKDAAERLD